MKIPTPISDARDQDRGVVWTLEAVLSVIVLFGILIFAVNNVPATSSSQEEVSRTQLTHIGEDIIDGASVNGQLKGTLLNWNAQSGGWVDASSEGTYVSVTPPQTAGHPLAAPMQLAENDGLRYNVEVVYETASGKDTEQIVFQGVPSGDVVLVEKTVVLSENDRVPGTSPSACGANPGEHPTLEQVDTHPGCDYFMPDTFSSDVTDRYNVGTVRLILWQQSA